MVRIRLTRALAVLFVALHAAACAGIESLDTESGPLSTAEQKVVRDQADASVAARRYRFAWDQEVAAGADRDRLERIAVEALAHRSRHAEAMFDALRAKWGALGAAQRARLHTRVEAARRAGQWDRALELELVSADDPPAFARAWAVYEAAPPDRAADLLGAIQEARADRTESTD